MRQIAIAFAVVLLQIALGLALAPGPDIQTRYFKLLNWDSQHYLDIARRGYVIHRPDIEHIYSDDIHADRSNVAFFPAYPILGRIVSRLTGVSVENALLFVAQFFAVLSWLYLLLLTGESWLVAALVYPTAFFMVAGYSESVFIASFLGLVYWSERAQDEGRASAWALVIAHGVLLTSSRLLGIPLAIYPLLRAWGQRRNLAKNFTKAAFASALSLIGALAFFAYCQERFGAWNLYLLLQERAWGNHPDYLALLKPLNYVPRFFFEDTMDSISRASVTAMAALMAYLCVRLKRGRPSSSAFSASALPILAVAFFLFYVSVSGKANAKMDSMSRYSLPIYVLLLVAWARVARAGGSNGSALSSAFSRALAVAGGLLQAYLFFMFLRGHWVA